MRYRLYRRALTFLNKIARKRNQLNKVIICSEKSGFTFAPNVTERISCLSTGKQGYSSILWIKVGIVVRLVLINNLEFRCLRRKTAQKVPMTKVSLYLPIQTVEAVEKIRGFYSVNRWCWRAISKQLETEMMQKIEA